MFYRLGSSSACAYQKKGVGVAARDEGMRLAEPIANGWKQMDDEMAPRLKAA